MSGRHALPRRRGHLAFRPRTILAAVATVAVVTTGIAATTPIAPTLASWSADEWDAARVGVLDCSDPATTLESRGEGRLLSGRLLGTDLDDLAELSGVTVTSDGQTSTATPNANPANPAPYAWANPLDVTALNAINLDLGDSLQLPLNNSTGVVGQYGTASTDGTSIGASGLLTDNGAVATEPSDGYPELATVNLKSLVTAVDPSLAGILEPVADVSLETGAVAGRAALDGCAETFQGQTSETVARQYLASSVNTKVESRTVSDLTTALDTVINDLETGVNGIASNQGVLGSVTTGVSNLLSGLLGTLRLGQIRAEVSATIDLSAVRTLLTEPFGDAAGVLEISPSDATIRVNTDALLEAAYPGRYSSGLNGLPPNTSVLDDPAVLTALTEAIGDTLNAWVAQLQTALTQALNLVQVTARVVVRVNLLSLLPIADITADVSASLGSLLSGTTKSTVGLSLLGIPSTVVAGLLDGLVGGLTDGLGLIVGNAVNVVLQPLSTIGTTVTNLLTPIVQLISTLWNVLYLDGLVSITVNAQNDPLSGAPEPADWASLPEGRYDVAALRIGILDVLGDPGVVLYLGRGSVGLD